MNFWPQINREGNVLKIRYDRLPAQVQAGLRSRSQQGQQVATMVNEQRDRVHEFLNNRENRCPEAVYENPDNNISFSVYGQNEPFRFEYKNSNFIQMENKDDEPGRTMIEDGIGSMNEIGDEGQISLTRRQVPNEMIEQSRIPFPVLLSCHNDLKTKYTVYTFDGGELINGGLQFDNPLALSNETMNEFLGGINQGSPVSHQNFKKQYEQIENFEKIKQEAFDQPARLAQAIYNILTNPNPNPNQNQNLNIDNVDFDNYPKFIIDINGNVERIEGWGQEDGSFFLAHYDEGNQKIMEGTFALVQDNGCTLKEDNDGRILYPDNPNYNNPQNKLCFNMKLEKYYGDNGRTSYTFQRTVDLKGPNRPKNMHNITYSLQDKNGNLVMGDDMSIPYLSLNKLKYRLPKVYHEIYKADLKGVKDVLTNKKIDPRDIQV